jgi:hypothetical protein
MTSPTGAPSGARSCVRERPTEMVCLGVSPGGVMPSCWRAIPRDQCLAPNHRRAVSSSESRPAPRPSTRLDPADVEAIAQRVAELIQRPEEWIDAAELARQLGVSRDFVYAHRRQLGGVARGDGPRPRWRFNPVAARAAFDAGASNRQRRTAKVAAPTRKRNPRRVTDSPLLPIRGLPPHKETRPATTTDPAKTTNERTTSNGQSIG